MFQQQIHKLLVIFYLISATTTSPCNDAQEEGAYTNLCGICVGGTTGLVGDEGLDVCGVCFGGGGCQQCNNQMKADGCGTCLDVNDPSWNSCIRIKSISPDVVDIAVQKDKITFLLHGINLNTSTLGQLTCRLKPTKTNDEFPAVPTNPLDEKSFQADFDISPLKVGPYMVVCNSTNNEISSDAMLVVVDSRLISVDSVSPRIVKTGIYFQATFHGTKISKENFQNVNVICFVRKNDERKHLLSVSAGRFRNNSIVCDEMVTTTSGSLKIGVAASMKAAEHGVSSELPIEARSSPLSPISAAFSIDLRQLLVTFNQNIESQSCDGLFTGTTKKMFGSDWDCRLRGNRLIIQLGSDAKVFPGSRLFLRHIASQEREISNSRLADLSSSTVVLPKIDNQIIPPHYRVVGPQMACRSSRSFSSWPSPFKDPRIRGLSDSYTTIEVQGLAGQNLRYNWTVGLAPVENSPKNVSQRDILLRWLSLRSMEKAIKKSLSNSSGEQVLLNNNLMLSGVEYVLTVRGENSLGEVGDERNISLKLVETAKGNPRTPEVSSLAISPAENLSDAAEHKDTETLEPRVPTERTLCGSAIPPDVVLLGSVAVFVDTESWVEVTVSCCDGQIITDVLNQVQYKWSVEEKRTGETIDTGSQNGKRLHLTPGVLRGGEKYFVQCHLVDGASNETSNSVLGHASMDMVTLERGVRTQVNVTSTVVGVPQTLVLDATKSTDLDNKPGSLKFEWRCYIDEDLKDPCKMPGSKKEIVRDHFPAEFKQSILTLPPGSLPIGRYIFTVTATKEKSHQPVNTAKVRVIVTGGQPALISVPPTQPILVNPEEGFVLSAVVEDLRPGCQIYWSFVQAVGYMYFNLSTIGLVKEMSVTADDETRREITLEFPRESSSWSGLVDDSRYLLRISAVCPAYRSDLPIESFSEVEIETDAPPVVREIMVDPKDGEALTTVFRFSTNPAYDQMSDHPLSYSFGFRVLNENENSHTQDQFFHTSTQQLWSYTYLPSLSSSESTKIQSILRVCDARKICKVIQGPLLSSRAPSTLTRESIRMLDRAQHPPKTHEAARYDGFVLLRSMLRSGIIHLHENTAAGCDAKLNIQSKHSNSIGKNFGTLLAAHEYEGALMLAETTLSTLATSENKTLYRLASQHIEDCFREQMRKFHSKLAHSRSSLTSALYFLDTAGTTLKHGSFSKSMLQELVAFRDYILHLLQESGNQRIKRDAQSGESSNQQTDILRPETVKTFLDISEAAILSLDGEEHALAEKQKLLQNLTYYMDALCGSLKTSAPVFIGSKVVSFSVQKLDLRTKGNAELAVPDWRSAKSGGKPVNATASVMLGPEISLKYPWSSVCMGGAIFPSDFLSEVFPPLEHNFTRFSAVYEVRIYHPLAEAPSSSNFDGVCLNARSTHFIIPVWNIELKAGYHFECAVWNSDIWDTGKCSLVKLATLSNKPAVECECSVLGFHTILSALGEPDSTTTSAVSSTPPKTDKTITQPSNIKDITTTTTTQSTTEQIVTTVKIVSRLPPGIPTTNSSQNFTFKINENFNATVGERRDVFTIRLKQQILDQVEMPANMIASIDIAPGSIIVTLHLVDTDIRTVDEVVPALAAALQSGQLDVHDIEGKHLSVPAQSLQMLQWRAHTEHANLLPWIVILCSLFSVACFTSFLVAAIVVRRKHYDTQLCEEHSVQEDDKSPTYRRFHLEESLDGTEAALARVRSNTSGPYVVGTVAGHAAAMGTNMATSSTFQNWLLTYELKPPHSPESKEGSNAETVRVNDSESSSGRGSSGNSGSRHKREISQHIFRQPTEDCTPIVRNEELRSPQGSDKDSGIVVAGRPTNMPLINQLGSRQSLRSSVESAPSNVILPGTPTSPTDKDNVA